MRNHSILSFVGALWLGVLPAIGQTPVDPAASPVSAVADETPRAGSAPGGTDPFIKGRPADPRVVPIASPPPGSATAPEGGPIVITLVYEVFSMDQQTLLAVLKANPDGVGRHAHLMRLLSEQKVTLDNVTAITTRSGQRCKVSGLHEFMYPVQFAIPDSAEQISRPEGGAMETRNLGDKFECEPTLAADGVTCDVTLAVEESRFLRWAESGMSQRGTLTAQPIVASRQLSTSLTLEAGEPSCVGSLSRHPDTSPEAASGAASPASLAFLTARLPSVEERRPNPLPPEIDQWHLSLTYLFYSLERTPARELLTGSSAYSAHERVEAMVQAGTARFERVLEMPTRSGQRSKTEENQEVIFPSEVVPLTFKDAVPGAHVGSAFETRFTGCRIEHEPVSSANAAYCDVTVAPEFVRVFGFGTTEGITALWPKNPVFESRSINTSLTAPRDRPALLGTFNFPRDTGLAGAKDDGRVWLGFVKASSLPR